MRTVAHSRWRTPARRAHKNPSRCAGNLRRDKKKEIRDGTGEREFAIQLAGGRRHRSWKKSKVAINILGVPMNELVPLGSSSNANLFMRQSMCVCDCVAVAHQHHQPPPSPSTTTTNIVCGTAAHAKRHHHVWYLRFLCAPVPDFYHHLAMGPWWCHGGAVSIHFSFNIWINVLRLCTLCDNNNNNVNREQRGVIQVTRSKIESLWRIRIASANYWLPACACDAGK